MASFPRSEQVLAKRLRLLILESVPKAEEKFYHDMSMIFYRHNKLICYIAQVNKGMLLGFNQGHLISDEEGILLKEGRKQVKTIYFQDIDEVKVRPLLFEAAMIDDTFVRN